MSEKSRIMPVVALRGMTILPGMLIHFDIDRKITVSAVEEAMSSDQMVYIVTQKNEKDELPEQKDFYKVGTIAQIKQLVRLPNNVYRIMVNGIERGVMKEFYPDHSILRGNIQPEGHSGIWEVPIPQKEAMLRSIKELVEEFFAINNSMGKASLNQLLEMNDLEQLMDQVTINMLLPIREKQRILGELQIVDRFDKMISILSQEIQVHRYKKDIQLKVKGKVEKSQKEYILREHLKAIQEELGENNASSDAQIYIEGLKSIKASKEVKDKIKEEIKRFANLSSNSAESNVMRTYIETLLSLPWDKSSQDNGKLKNAEAILNRDHYGMVKVKERILEFLAVRNLTKKGDSPIICLVGPPGTGKTSIAKSVAEALNKKYIRLSLGGVKDEAEIRGHRRTYIGAMPGRIIMGLKNAGVKNPLMLLDEIDKTGSDYKGDTASALLEVLDGEQNVNFVDHYIELPVDLSEVLFIATANTIQTIPKPLLDRMEIIEVFSYTENEKFHIAKKHLLDKQREKHGLQKKQLSISPKALEHIIGHYTREAGVRNLERKIGQLCRKVAWEIVSQDKMQVKISEKNLERYLGKARYSYNLANGENEVGIVRGLAWTSVGGDTLQIEVNVMPGKGRLELTGQLGDVMKESAKTAISYIRSVSQKHQIEPEFFDKNDIHIHIPEGAVPKDGPSAGITMATAMISAMTNRKVNAQVAMTGEITLRGRVLPIGGLKEKILAAKKANIKLVLVPGKNEKDVLEIEKEIREGIVIQYVNTMEEVLTYGLV